MRTVLLALLIALLIPAAAQGHVTKPGYAEIRQHGTAVNFTLGIQTDALTEFAAGDSKQAIADYLGQNVRVNVDGESCPGAMTRATPERHNGAAYTRAWMTFQCPEESGKFVVINEIPLDSIVDYELGGATGTFLFDEGHNTLDAAGPGFPRFVEKGVEHIVLGWDHVVFLIILLLGAKSLRDVLKLATVFTVAHSVTLALAILGIVNVPSAIVEPLIAASIVVVAAMQVLGIESNTKYLIVFAFGLLHGLGFAGAVSFPDGTPILSALIGFNLGIELGQAMIILVVFPILLGIRRFEWSQSAQAAAGSAAAAIGLFWLSQRVLGG